MTKASGSRPSFSLVTNSRWNLVAFGASLAAQFVAVPFALKWIGLEAFGGAAVVLSICAPMSLVGTVLGQALIREISSRDFLGETSTIEAYTSAAMRWCLLICLMGALALVLFGPSIASVLVSVEVSYTSLLLAFLIAASGSMSQQVVFVLQSVSAAQQDYQTVARITIFSAFVSSILILLFSWMYSNSNGYLIGVSFGFHASALVWLWRWKACIKWNSIFSMLPLRETKALIKFGKWQGLAQFAGVMGNQIDRYALGAMASVSAVGQFTVANRLQEAAYIGVMKAGEVVFPRFGSMSSSESSERQAFFLNVSWAMGVLSSVILAPLAVLSTDVLALWVGPEAAVGADHMLSVLVIGGIIGSASNVFTYYAMGIGRNASVAGIATLFSLLTIILTVALINILGPQAAGGGLLIASIFRVFASILLTRKLFFPGLGWGNLCVSIVIPPLVGVVVALAGQYIIGAGAKGWIATGGCYLTLCAVVIFVNILASCSTRQGRRILRTLSRDTWGH